MHCIQTHSLVVCSWLWVVEVFLEISILFWLVCRVGSHLQTVLLKMSLHFGRSLMWERKSNKSEISTGRFRCRRYIFILFSVNFYFHFLFIHQRHIWHMWNRDCPLFRSTWVHYRFLVVFVLIGPLLSLWCYVDLLFVLLFF